MRELQKEWLENIQGEIVEIQEQPDGSAISILEGEAVRKWKSFDYALEMLYRAGWIF